MITIIQHTPGQTATIFFENIDSQGDRFDGYVPFVSKVILPDLSHDISFPKEMTYVEEGLYTFQYKLPVGAISVGSYLLEVMYVKENNQSYSYKLYQIVVTSPFGNYGATSF